MRNKIYVGNLSLSATKEQLTELFSSAGTIGDVTIMKDPNTGRSKGFAFITFATRLEASNAVERFNRYEFLSHPLIVHMADGKKERGNKRGRGR